MKYFLGFILKVMREMVRKVRIKKSHYLEGRYIKDVQVTGL